MFRTKGILLVTTFLCFPGVISATCPPSSYKDLNDTLQSPGYSMGEYPANQSCTYDVRVPAGKRIILSFKSFKIWGSMPHCPQDSLEIIVGCGNLNRSLGKFCSCSNLSMPDKIYTYDNCLTLVFKSDGANESLGFLAEYSTTDNNVTRLDPINNCSNDLVTSSHGTIFSPFWPLKYPQEKECRWQFSPPLGKIVRLFFTSVEFENIPSCRDPSKPLGRDDLVILNGTNTTGYEFKKKICFLPSSFTVMKNMTAIGLHFVSDDVDTPDGTGFMAGYATYVEGEEDPGCLMSPTIVPTSTTGLTSTTTVTKAPTKVTKAPTTTLTAGTKEGLSGGAIAGIAIAGAVLCLALIGGLIWWKKSKTSGETKVFLETQPA